MSLIYRISLIDFVSLFMTNYTTEIRIKAIYKLNRLRYEMEYIFQDGVYFSFPEYSLIIQVVQFYIMMIRDLSKFIRTFQ